MQYDASGSQSLMEEIARNGPEDPGQAFFGVEALYGYIWREGLDGRWRLYRDVSSEDYLEGADSDVLAERSFLTPRGDTLLYVLRGAEVQAYVAGETRSQTVTGMASTDWHTGTGTMFTA